ncbi:DUF3040 domain-containing protein [Rhodococcus sp. D2-41]|uniref:DUF3040 domain-containing protein n=1 Tax=Speluncibacter jeojiensis TaxID=2710754 RepID=A0A9X4M2Y4_9ACTN|nr:DUF3040 domain-containing protein [Rhodococcus sp. D2-41]MDG3011987.1 DUF3040 domain-containing protein [Rhodococcus sp. D2-41]MDG3013441.1 DUF3040 domain-containing protein [Corynebacteriales bacterium D3-21]
MPLSEHEQRMLDEIESALYAEDPKFASHVKGRRFRTPSNRRRLQAVTVLVLGLVLLVLGVALPLKPGGFPIVSLIGFIVMFGGGVMLLLGGSLRQKGGAGHDDAGQVSSGGRGHGGRGRGKNKAGGGFSSRMEERFRKRFEQDDH